MLDKKHECRQCHEFKTIGCFYNSKANPGHPMELCIGCIRENRIAREDYKKKHDSRSRREREYAALNHKRDKRIREATKVYEDFHERCMAHADMNNPEVASRAAVTYQHLKQQIEEAVAEPIL